MSLQHSKCVKYAVNGEVLARQGAMVAFRGNLGFEVKSQGVGNFLKRAVTGEGVSLMAVRGQGEVWFASGAADCFVMELEANDALSINGRSIPVLRPEPAVQHPDDPRRRHVRRRAVQLASSPARAGSPSAPRARRS